MSMAKTMTRTFTVAETTLQSAVGAIQREVAPHVHETILLSDTFHRFAGGEGFVVYDEGFNTTDFYARVEVEPDRVTILLPTEFVEPLVESKNPQLSEVHVKVNDVKGKPKTEKTITGKLCTWGIDEFFVVQCQNDRSAPKLCRMLIASAWKHREAVQATIPKWD